jgi:L-phenylalanine/L-methionine N-acetyltransferase
LTPGRRVSILPRMDITVRRAEPEDFEGFWRNFQDESAYSGTLQLPYPSREMWRKRLAEPTEGHYNFVACSGDEIVGNAGLHAASASPRRAHVMAVGIGVPSAWQGRGVGTALLATLTGFADGWLNVWRLELTVYADNARAIALYRKFGFEAEGTHRAYALRDGKYVDAIAMARLRPKAS